ncbi:MAG: hypothetical protein ACREEP_18355, partial [Dongiaceae bacterium]
DQAHAERQQPDAQKQGKDGAQRFDHQSDCRERIGLTRWRIGLRWKWRDSGRDIAWTPSLAQQKAFSWRHSLYTSNWPPTGCSWSTGRSAKYFE